MPGISSLDARGHHPGYQSVLLDTSSSGHRGAGQAPKDISWRWFRVLGGTMPRPLCESLRDTLVACLTEGTPGISWVVLETSVVLYSEELLTSHVTLEGR